MTTIFNISVLDANGIAIEGAFITLDSQNEITDKDGLVTLSGHDGENDPHIVQISHPYYVAETVEFRGGIGIGQWNNALMVRSVVASRVSLTIRLGRLNVAPTVLKSESEVNAMASKKGDPHASLLFDLPRDSSYQAYRFQWNNPVAVELMEDKALPEKAPLPEAKG